MTPSLSSTEREQERDRVVVLCSSCGGPFFHDESSDASVECMCSDEPDTPLPERLSCRRCGDAIVFNDDLDTDPMDCGCPPATKPDSYRILSKAEAIDRAREFL